MVVEQPRLHRVCKFFGVAIFSTVCYNFVGNCSFIGISNSNYVKSDLFWVTINIKEVTGLLLICLFFCEILD